MHKSILILLMIFLIKESKAQLNRYSGPGVESTLKKNDPLISDQMLIEAMKARKAQIAQEISNFKEYYSSLQYFKTASNGTLKGLLINNNEFMIEQFVNIKDNKIISIESKSPMNSSNGLRVPSEIKNGYSKVFYNYENQLWVIEVYFEELFLMDNPSKSNTTNTSDPFSLINTNTATSGLDISIFDTPNMATNKIIFSIPFKGKISSILKAENDFYKITYKGKIGYIYNKRITDLTYEK